MTDRRPTLAQPSGEAHSRAESYRRHPSRALPPSPLLIGRLVARSGGLRYRWILVALAGFGTLEINFHGTFYATLIPTLRDELSLSYSLAQSLMSVFSLAYGLMQIPVGVMMDRFGSRSVVLASLAVFSLGALLVPLTQSYEYGLATRLLVGLGASAVYLPGLRVLSTWFPAARISTVMGLISIGTSLGQTLALWLVPRLSATMGWRWSYFAGALSLPVVLLLYAAFCANRPADIGVGSPVELSSPRPAAPPIRVALGAVARDPNVWVFGVAGGLYYGSYIGLIAWAPTYFIQELGRSASEAGTLTSFLPIFSIVTYPILGLVSDQLGRRRLFVVGALLQASAAIAFTALAGGLSGTGLVLFMLIFAVAAPALLNGLPLAFQRADRRYQGTALGLANTMTFGGGFVVPVLLAALVDYAGKPHFAFFGISVLTLAAGALALASPPMGRPERAASVRSGV